MSKKHKVVVSQSDITAGQMRDFWRMVGDGTLNGKVLAHILENIAKIRNEALKGDFVTLVRVKEIMGKNLLAPAVAKEHFGIAINNDGVLIIPFSEDVLRECQKTHILVYVPEISVLKIRAKIDQKLFYKQNWYNSEEFAKNKGKEGWYLIRKDAVLNSYSKDYQNQLSLLKKNEEVPTARVMVYSIICYYLETGERLFLSTYVRCCDFFSDGRHVNVGDFDSDGLNVYRFWDVSVLSSLGLASARKFRS